LFAIRAFDTLSRRPVQWRLSQNLGAAPFATPADADALYGVEGLGPFDEF
jgi:hypothetical protein